MDSRAFSIALSLYPKIGPKRAQLLMDYFGSAYEVFEADKEEVACVLHMQKTDFIHQFNPYKYLLAGEKILKESVKKEIQVIDYHDPIYPKYLKRIPDAPIVLYYIGEITPGDYNAVAIVGTRTASEPGKSRTIELASYLSKTLTIVSGMALGIDTHAHMGALQAGGRTIAVLGSGLDIIYPAKNKKLFESICQNGAVISQFPIGTRPEAYNFPIRNKTIAGLSLGVIVVEGLEDSGSLITANRASEYGCEVFAYPGAVDDINSSGPRALIKKGARLINSPQDVINVLNPSLDNSLKSITVHRIPTSIEILVDEDKIKDSQFRSRSVQPFEEQSQIKSPKAPVNKEKALRPSAAQAKKDQAVEYTINLSPLQQQILDLLSNEEDIHLDNIVAQVGLPLNKISPALLEMEFAGICLRKSGNYYKRLS